MSFIKDLFDGRRRRARALEGRGDFRGAAALYAEIGLPLEAGSALVHAGDRAADGVEREAAWVDALRVLPESAGDLRRSVESKLGRSVLAHARESGVAGAAERERLAEAAARLERARAYAEAADAWQLLGRREDEARCLELGGEVERLETLLSQANASDARTARLRRLVSEAELAEDLGDRVTARSARREAVALAPGDPDLVAALRALEARWVAGPRVVLAVDGARVAFVGRLPAVLGRADADVNVRGASVSRRHAELALEGGALVLRDLDSKNGTLVGGVPIGRPLVVAAEIEVGLGEDAAVRLRPDGARASLEVTRGLDRGSRAVVGAGALPLGAAPAELVFEDERCVLAPAAGTSLTLGGRRIAGRIDLLRGDVLSVGGVRVEVEPS